MSVSPGPRLALRGTGCLVAPGIVDPLTALLVERLGFRALYLGGNALGLALGVGQPFVTLTETVASAGAITAATSSPLIVDAATGFGSPAHVERAIMDLARAGVSAVHIDDQHYPKRVSYHFGVSAVVDQAQACARIEAAADACRRTGVTLIARTDIYRVTSRFRDVVARAQALAEAGADAVLPLDLSPTDLKRLRDEVPNVPVVTFAAYRDSGPSFDAFEEAGVALVMYPLATVAAISRAVTSTWDGFFRSGRVNLPDDVLASERDALQALLGMDRKLQVERRDAAGN